MIVTVTVKVNTETGDYELVGDDGDSRSEGSLLDTGALTVDICGALGLSL